MNKIKQLVILLLVLVACKNEILKEDLQPIKKPNIVFLIADDMAYGELGCYGQKIIETPFLDSLPAKGVKFNQFYANAVCSPSRAAFMTGKHPGYTSVRGNSAIGDNNLWYRMVLKKEEQGKLKELAIKKIYLK